MNMKSVSGPALLIIILCVVSGCSEETYFESLYKSMEQAQNSLKEVAVAMNKGLKTLAQTIRFVENFIDSTVEEDCYYKCPGRGQKIAVDNPNHVPKSNGCGSLGVFFEEDDLPRPEMVDCCNMHDICYDTCGSDKEDCDRKFKRCLYNICDVSQNAMDVIGIKKCKGGSKLLYTATMAFGCTSFRDAQHNACICVDSKDRRVPHEREEL